MVCRSSCVPTVESLAGVERAALAGAVAGTRLAVVSGSGGSGVDADRGVLHPPGPRCVLGGRRRRSSTCASSCALHFHAKSNGIDAETLARMPIADPRGLQQLELPGPDAAALDRRVRACDRLTRAASEHKVRIKDLVRQLMPMTPLTGDLGKADLQVLERYADPRALLAASVEELTSLITGEYPISSRERAEPGSGWPPPRPAIELDGDHPAVPMRKWVSRGRHRRIRLLQAIQVSELAAHARAPASCTTARSIPAGRPGPCPGSPRSAPRSWSRSWVGRAASGTGPGQVLCRARPAGPRDRPDRPQGPADEQAGPGRQAAGPRCSAPPTSPAGKTRSSPGSTTCR